MIENRRTEARAAAITAIETGTRVPRKHVWALLFEDEGTSGNEINYSQNTIETARAYIEGFDWTGEPDPELLNPEQQARFNRHEKSKEQAERYLDELHARLKAA